MKSLKFIFSILLLTYGFTSFGQLTSSSSNDLYSNIIVNDNPSIIILKPKIINKNNNLLIEWQGKSLGANSDNILYEVIIKNHDLFNDKFIYRNKTKNNFIEIPSNVGLINGQSYQVIINTYLEQVDKSILLKTDNNKLVFTYDIPDCKAPTNIRKTNKGEQYLIEWDGVDAEIGKYRYEIRYRQLNQENNWSIVKIEKGRSYLFPQIAAGTIYEVQIRRVCIFSDNDEMESDWVNVGILGESISLRANCGQPFSDGPDYPAGCIANFQKIYVSGYEIDSMVLTKINEPGQTCKYVGFGRLYMAWANKYVTVELNNVTVSNLGIVGDGCTILGVRDVPPYLPDYNGKPGVFKDICGKVPSDQDQWDENGIHRVTGLPYDQNGFDQSGKYVKVPPYEGYQPGDPIDTSGQYDPWGYDKNGIHFETGTKNNPNGCTQQQLNSPPQAPPCDTKPDPYYWLNKKGPVTEEGAKFADQKKNALDSIMRRLLPLLAIDIEDEYNKQQITCDSIRNKIRLLVDELEYDTAYIYGRDAKYLNFGMSKNFSQAPRAIQDVIEGRDPNDIILEKDHVALYSCDIRQLNKSDSLLIINKMNSNLYSEVYTKLLNLIKGFTKEQVELYKDSILFDKWVLDQLELDLKIRFDTRVTYQQTGSNFDDSYLVNNSNHEKEVENNSKPNINNNFISPFNHHLIGSSIVSNDEDPETLKAFQNLEAAKKQFQFDYEQGLDEVGGISRAFILEAIAKARYESTITMPFTETHKHLMPIEFINRGADGNKFCVYFDNMRFKWGNSYMDIWFIMDIPGNDNKRAVFRARDVIHNFNGIMGGAVKLQLEKDIEIPISDKVKITIQKGDSTFVSVDCEGYGGLSMKAEVEFCRNFVKPADTITNKVLPEPSRVKGQFYAFVTSFTELYISINVDPFVVTDYENAIWKIQDVTFDFSDIKSPDGSLPEDYTSEFAQMPGGFTDMWRGVYFKNISVSLQQKFSKDPNKRINIGVNNAIFDDQGFSGGLYASPLLSLEDGNAGGWAMSIDSIKLVFVKSELRQGKMSGNLHVPLFKEKNNTSNQLRREDCFKYTTAFLKGSKFLFSISQPDGVVYKADLWKAGEVFIKKSEVTMVLDSTDFYLYAKLSGAIKVGGQNSGIPLSMKDSIRFENLELSNKDPYFSPGNWLVPGEVDLDLGGFSLTISNIGMGKNDEGKPTLRFDARINIGDKDQVSGGGAFRIIGRREDSNGTQKWIFDSFVVDGIDVNAEFSGIKLAAFLKFYDNDPKYGKGWRGGGLADFSKLKVSISAVAQFGKVNNKKYFMIDGMVCADIPMADPLIIKGFGGGAYWGMKRVGQLPNFPPLCSGTPVIPTTIGASLTGFVYEPNDSFGLGIKAIIALGLRSAEEAFNANVSLEVSFMANGGLDKIRLDGRAQMMAKLNLGDSPNPYLNSLLKSKMGLNGNINILWDHQNKLFSADMELYVNAGLMKGANDGMMGKVAILISEDKWYIKVGKPWNRDPGTTDERCGIIVGFGNLLSISAKCYLQLGNSIDPIGPIPDKVSKIVGVNFGNPLSNVKNVTGFSFGLELGARFDIDLALVYAKAELGLGFDAGLYNFSDYSCVGYGKPGHNGWYAIGQAWAYFAGEAGIKAKIFGRRRTFKIASLEAAAALQMGLPNPTWFKGGFGIKYEFLGGLVKGKASFSVEKGTVCVLKKDSVDADDNLQVIADISPKTDAKLDANSNILVDFNIPLNENVEIKDIDGTVLDKYFVTVSEVKMNYKQYHLNTSYKFNGNKQLQVSISDYMPSDDTVTFFIKLNIKDKTGQDTIETKTQRFVTNGAYIGTILPSNILDAYPMDGQYNFYKEMSGNQGVIALKIGQPDIFWDDNYEIKAELTSKGLAKKVVPVNYDFYTNILTYDASSLAKGKIYRLEIIKKAKTIPNYQNVSVDDNPVTQLPPSNSIIYTSYFRVSNYDKIQDKMSAWVSSLHDVSTNRDYQLEYNAGSFEPFDNVDIANLGVNFQLKNTKYFNDVIDGLFSLDNAVMTFYCVCDPASYAYCNQEYWMNKLSYEKSDVKLYSNYYKSILVSKSDYLVGSIPNANNLIYTLVFDFPTIYNSKLGTWRASISSAKSRGYNDACESEGGTFIMNDILKNESLPTIQSNEELPITWEYKILSKVSNWTQNADPLMRGNSLNNKVTLKVGQ